MTLTPDEIQNLYITTERRWHWTEDSPGGTLLEAVAAGWSSLYPEPLVLPEPSPDGERTVYLFDKQRYLFISKKPPYAEIRELLPLYWVTEICAGAEVPPPLRAFCCVDDAVAITAAAELAGAKPFVLYSRARDRSLPPREVYRSHR